MSQPPKPCYAVHAQKADERQAELQALQLRKPSQLDAVCLCQPPCRELQGEMSQLAKRLQACKQLLRQGLCIRGKLLSRCVLEVQP